MPKAVGKLFEQSVYFGGDYYYGNGSVWGESSTNAVIQHQRVSTKNPTSGISTTPSLEKAKSYATHDGKYQSGYVYKIDTDLLEEYGVLMYPVADPATSPAVPENQEVILVAKDCGEMPSEIIVDVFEIVPITPQLT